MNWKYVNKTLPTLVLFTIFITSCSPTPRTPDILSVTKSPTVVYRNASYITEFTLAGLTQRSELIVRGRITDRKGILNLARDVNDFNKPDPKLFAIGQIYGFEVIQKIKVGGDELPGDEIKIVQVEGLINSPSSQTPSIEEIEAARSHEWGSPFILNQEYILFLDALSRFDELKGYYTVSAHPWQFIIEKGCAYPETPWYYAKYFYQPQETEKFVAEIIASLSAKVTPLPKMVYPAPGTENTCQPRTDTEVSYP